MRSFYVMLAATALASGQTTTFAQSIATPESLPASTAHPENWPVAESRGLIRPDIEKDITALMAQLSLEEKVGQLIQGDIGSMKPEDLITYPLGSILAGGSSAPLGAPDRSHAGPWLATAKAFEAIAMAKRQGHTPIPLLLGIDAVHGNSNVVGATIFPHNIALGATRDPALIQRIGRATALETAAVGFNWAFAPTLTVPQDDRWGRTFEGYSEDPAIVASFAGPMVVGLQGEPGKGTIQQGYVAASVKHFLGDGGTFDGVDQGDTRVDEATLVRIHNAGYPNAIKAGAMTVMASYNSWNGQKMHGNQSLLTNVLKGRMGFAGLVVGDWNGHGQINSCTPTDCPRTFNSGLDMAMAPDSWKGLFDNTLAQARDGRIPMARIDDAVRRVLRVKFALGLFNPQRPYEVRSEVIGSPDHRAIAREAVQRSLVLLKNNGVLPIKASANILVAGDAGDDIGRQSGGWTLSWQGDGNVNADFPGATSIFAGIANAAKAGGGKANFSADGSFTERPDVAVVVFGEMPYAEMRGDIRSLEFEAGDKQALALLKRLKLQGIPVVSVFLSGRPMWTNPEINQSDAFVAAWYPGSEGAGIADVLIGGAKDFHGTLSFSWPKTANQFRLNKGEAGYDPLFALGYGLSYAKPGKVGVLSEVAGIDSSLGNTSVYFSRGKPPLPFALSLDPSIKRTAVDSATTQEGAMLLKWAGNGTIAINGPVLVLQRELNADMNLQVTYRAEAKPKSHLRLSFGGAAVEVAPVIAADGTWHQIRVPLKCFKAAGADLAAVKQPFALSSEAGTAITIADVRLATDPAGAACPG